MYGLDSKARLGRTRGRKGRPASRQRTACLWEAAIQHIYTDSRNLLVSEHVLMLVQIQNREDEKVNYATN